MGYVVHSDCLNLRVRIQLQKVTIYKLEDMTHIYIEKITEKLLACFNIKKTGFTRIYIIGFIYFLLLPLLYCM